MTDDIDRIARGLTFPMAGLRLIENDMLTIGPFEDWAQVRSPGRAARRRRRGHAQRIRIYHKPDPKMYRLPNGSIVGHPATMAALRAHLKGPSHE